MTGRIRTGDGQRECPEGKSRTLVFSGLSNVADGGEILEIGSSGRVLDWTRRRMSPTQDGTVEKRRKVSPTQLLTHHL